MPPLPVNLQTISQQAIQLDFLKRAALIVAGGATVDLNEQLQQEQLLQNSKRRWGTLVYPFRMVHINASDLAVWNSNPNYWWSHVGWGQYLNFGKGTIGTYGFADDVPPYTSFGGGLWGVEWGISFEPISHQKWLCSIAVDAADAGQPFRVQQQQFLSTARINYQIWQVTMRFPFGGGDYTSPYYDTRGLPVFPGGVIPPPYPPIGIEIPWSYSTDFLQTGSGTLNPDEVFTIPVPNLTPRASSQVPPAGTNDGVTPIIPADNTAWIGWGVANYMVFI